VRWDGPDGYYASDDASLLDFERIGGWLADESYWATGRPLDAVRQSFGESLAIGVYAGEGGQAGVCRWVTDHVSFAWLCDVFVDTAHRGRGLGVFMVGVAVAHDEVRDVRLRLLATRDAHSLYERFGFAGVAPGRFLELRQA
jgi:GNAT superfamily N-acetyltransferase